MPFMLTPILATDDPYIDASSMRTARGRVGHHLAARPWGERAFHAVLGGYRFLIAAQDGEGRLDRRLRPGQDGQVKDWVAWHHGYDDPSSALSDRLERVERAPVRGHRECAARAGPDRQPVRRSGPRRPRRTAWPSATGGRPGPAGRGGSTNAQVASDRAAAAGLTRVYVREADAGLIASFADVLPADVLLLCGIFGNVSDSDIKRTVGTAAALCAGGATVIWTRHRRPPDLTPQLRAWFAASGFDEVAFDALGTTG